MAKQDEQTRALLMHSGGLDSTVLGLYLNEKNSDFVSLFIRYDQTPAERELVAARQTASMLRVRFDVIELQGLRAAFTSSTEGVFVLEGNPGKHVLELGNAVKCSLALAYARRHSLTEVYLGLTKYDADYSAEYSQPFLDAFSGLSEIAGFPRIAFKAPFIGKSKAEVIKIAAKHPRVLAATWTCFNPGPLQCGICESCESRKAAFKTARVQDPTRYEDEA
jgi:7-cyano-7-deazaguanine synthase